MGLRRASLNSLSRAKVRKVSSLADRGDVVTMAALGLIFGGAVSPSTRDVLEDGQSDAAGDDLYARQHRLTGIPGVGIEAHCQAVGTRARSEAHVGRLA